MQCVICKVGGTQPGKTIYSIVKDNRVIIIKDVDAAICDNCEEAYFSPEVSQWLSEKVDEAIKNSLGEVIHL